MFAIGRHLAGRGLAAAAGALLLGGALSTSALAWEGPVEGRPRGFHAGAASGYYLWHSGHHWHLETTSQFGTSHVYSGTLATDGRFVDVTSVRTENDDAIELLGDDTVRFEFRTASGLDGLAWSVHGGSRLTLLLFVDGLPAPPQLIYVGRNHANPPGSPLTFWR